MKMYCSLWKKFKQNTALGLLTFLSEIAVHWKYKVSHETWQLLESLKIVFDLRNNVQNLCFKDLKNFKKKVQNMNKLFMSPIVLKNADQIMWF